MSISCLYVVFRGKVFGAGPETSIVLVGFDQKWDELEFVGMRCTIPSPGGKVPQCAHWGG